MKLSKLVIGSALLLGLASGCLDSVDLPDEWPCKSNADCSSGEKCFDANDREGKHCKAASYCTTESDCAPDEYCSFQGQNTLHTNVCTKAQCKDNSPCGSYACDRNIRTCYTTCSSSSSCASGWICIGGACVVPQCTGTNPSPCLGYACFGDGVCGTSCASSSECAPGYSCVAPSCVYTGENLPCATSFQCTTAPYTYCSTNGACHLACDQRPCSVEGELCESCDSSTYVCGSNGMCRAACAGMACDFDGDAYCGQCDNGWECIGNTCTDPCTGLECGYAEPSDAYCGQCAFDEYCSGNFCFPL